MEHREFWQNRLLFYTVKARELGRQYRFRVDGKQRREWILFYNKGRFAYDVDDRTGSLMVRLCQQSTQKVIDTYPQQVEVRNCLQQIQTQDLLPRIRGSCQ